MSEEHYRILGISPDADKAEIRAAYKQRVKETHPDLNDDPNAAAEFQRVKEARDALLGSGATGAASGGTGPTGPGSSRGRSTSGTDGTRTSSSGGASSGGRTGTSGSGADSRDPGTGTEEDGARANYSTRTEEPSGDHRDQYGGGTSSDRTAGGASSSETGRSGRTRTDRSETGGASNSRRESGSAAGGRASSGSTDRGGGSGTGAGGTQDYVRFRSVIEEPTGSRAASYDRVVSSTHTPARQGTEGAGGTRSDHDASIAAQVPAFFVVLAKQYIYSLKWALLGLPLTFLYLLGIRGLYFSGLQPSFLSYVLGAVGLSLVKARLGVNFAGTATLALCYYVFVWFPGQPYGPLSLLEVGLAVHLLPLFVITALIAEYK